MNRLQKFVEEGLHGEKPGRTAYAFGSGNLPKPGIGLEWKPVASFRPADELMENADLKEIFKAAIKNGCAVSPERPPETSMDNRPKSKR
jgi:hypothetical protein